MQTNSKSVDGLRRVVSAKAHPVRAQRMPAPVQKGNNSFNFAPAEIAVEPVRKASKRKFTLTLKRLVPYAITVFVTFCISIATSQGIAKINFSDSQTFQQTTELPRSSELTVTSQPTNPTLYDKVLTKPGFVHLAEENIDAPDPLSERKAFLETYLKARGSILAKHVDALSEQSQWKLIIAISRAESSFCKKNRVNNCWGVGGAWNLRSYDNYDEAIADVNRLLEKKYVSLGLDTPDKIVNKWVGHPNDNWEAAVQQELDNLKDVQ